MSLSNKEILTNLIERKIGNLLDSSDLIVNQFLSGNPAMSKIVQNVVNVKKKEYLPQLQEYSDLLVETSCIDTSASLEQCIANAETTLNEFITKFISDKMGVPQGTVQISLQALFGEDVLKL